MAEVAPLSTTLDSRKAKGLPSHGTLSKHDKSPVGNAALHHIQCKGSPSLCTKSTTLCFGGAIIYTALQYTQATRYGLNCSKATYPYATRYTL